MTDVFSDIIAEGARIEREKNERALTEGEAKTLAACAFLRRLAPYVFGTEIPPAPVAVDPQDAN